VINGVIRTESEIAQAYNLLSDAFEIGCDTETSGLDAGRGRLLSLQFSDGRTSVLIPLSEGVDPGPFRELLKEESKLKIFHNAKFDLKFLKAKGFEVRGVFDTMIAEKLIIKGANQSASLADTLYRYFAVDLDKSQRQKFGKKWDGIWSQELVEYALSDVVYLPKLKKEQSEWLKRLGLYQEFEQQIKALCASI
jgi:ribonuclease D